MGLFDQTPHKVSTLALFKSILDHKQYLPREQPYKDLVNLIQFLLRQFFKAVEDDPFIIVHVSSHSHDSRLCHAIKQLYPLVQALYPKNRGHWKQFSSWKPEEKFVEREKQVAAEVQVTQGYTWTEEMGIVIACLVEDEKTHLINWVKEVSPLDTPALNPLSPVFTDTLGCDNPEETYNRGNRQGRIRRRRRRRRRN